MTTWRTLIQREMADRDEAFSDVVSTTLTDSDLDREFSDDYGGTEGLPFTLWTEKRVYFPVCYDGAEWCGSAPRQPCSEVTEHMGWG